MLRKLEKKLLSGGTVIMLPRLPNLKVYLGLCLLIGTVTLLSMFHVMTRWYENEVQDEEKVYLSKLGEGLSYSGDIIKSSIDSKTYSTMVLANELRFMVISDPSTQVAAVSCDLNVGSFEDPPHIPGLAHLLEHALFLGDKLHPTENSFEQFLGEHNGHSNAFTSQENTNYYYKINPDVLEESIQRFTSLLSKPLLKEEAVKREYHAIESEFLKDKLENVRRVWRLLKHLARPDHPFHRLSPGSFVTLNTSDTIRELVKFHKQYYSAERMKCVVFGREDPQDLMEMAKRYFGLIPKQNKTPNSNADNSYLPEPYPANLLGQFVEYSPLREGNDLDIFWPLSGASRCGVGGVSRVLSGSHPRSALAILKKKGWATSLSWSVITSTSTFSVLRVNVKLTKLGADVVLSVVKVIFAQINVLKTESHLVPRGRLARLHQESLQAFINYDNVQAHHFVKTIATRMNRVLHPAYFLGAPLQASSVSCYIKTLGKLFPQNSIIMSGTDTLDTELTGVEPWYQIPYSSVHLTDYQLENVQNNYGLAAPPAPKGAITKTFPLYEGDIKLSHWPSLIYTDVGVRVWWQQDFTFHTPRTDIVLWVFQSQEHSTAYEVALNYLLVNMIRDQLGDKIIPVGYQIELRYQSSSGFVVLVSGYSDHEQILYCIRELVATITRLDLTQGQRFIGVVRYQAHRELSRSRFAEAYKHPLFKSRVLLEKNIVPIEDILSALDQISLRSFARFYKTFILNIGVRCLVYGNVLQSMAHQYTVPMLTLVKNSVVSDLPFHPTIQYPKGTYVLRADYPNDKETASVADLTFVLGPTTWNSDNIQTDKDLFTRSVLARLLATLLQEPAFAELRTKQQLGYSVFTKYLSHFGIDYIHVCVQGSGHSALTMANSILAFLEDYRATLVEILTSEDRSHWESIIQSVKEDLLVKPTNQKAMVLKLSAELFSPDPGPDRADMFIAALEDITSDHVIQFYDDYIIGSETRKVILLSEPENLDSRDPDVKLNTDFKELGSANKTDESAVFLYWHFTFLGIEMGK